MKKELFDLLTRAIKGLKELTDPACQYSPYERFTPHVKYPDIKKIFVLRKRMMWRI